MWLYILYFFAIGKGSIQLLSKHSLNAVLVAYDHKQHMLDLAYMLCWSSWRQHIKYNQY